MFHQICSLDYIAAIPIIISLYAKEYCTTSSSFPQNHYRYFQTKKMQIYCSFFKCPSPYQPLSKCELISWVIDKSHCDAPYLTCNVDWAAMTSYSKWWFTGRGQYGNWISALLFHSYPSVSKLHICSKGCVKCESSADKLDKVLALKKFSTFGGGVGEGAIYNVHKWVLTE